MIVASLLVVSALTGAVAPVSEKSKKITVRVKFEENIKEALSEAAFRNVPLLVVFSSDGWSGCGVLESGILANKVAAPYIEESFVSLLGQPGNKHEKVKIPHPERKGEEREVCCKYGIPCATHQRMYSELKDVFKLQDVKTVPAAVVVNPHAFLAKAPTAQTSPDIKMVDIIYKFTREFTLGQLKDLDPDVAKAMPGERATAKTYEDYKDARALQSEEKLKEAEAAFQKLSKKRLPKLMSEDVQKRLAEIQAKVAKG